MSVHRKMWHRLLIGMSLVAAVLATTVPFAHSALTYVCAKGQEVSRYFFYVPKGTERFRMRMSGSGKETASFRLFGPDSLNLVEELGLSARIEREIDARTLAGRVCWIEVTDIIEDHGFGLVGIPNIFAWRPQQFLAPKEQPPEGSVIRRSDLNTKIQRNVEAFQPPRHHRRRHPAHPRQERPTPALLRLVQQQNVRPARQARAGYGRSFIARMYSPAFARTADSSDGS